MAIVKVCAAQVDKLVHLLCDRGDYFRVTVPGRANGHAGVAVQKYITVRVGDPNSLGVVGDEFIVRPRVARRHVRGICVDNFKRFRSRKLGFDNGTL